MWKLTGLFFFLFAGIIPGSNSLQTAQKQMQEKQYATAVVSWREALSDHPTLADPIEFNLAQTLLLADSAAAALPVYQKLQRRLTPEVRTILWNQSGVILAKEKDTRKTALEAFRKALSENPDNESARYNYELLLRQIQQQEPPPPPPPPPSNVPPPPPIPPTEASASLIKEIEQSPEELKTAKAVLESRQVQFIQQIRKKMRGAGKSTPQW